ncbi:hypothetical protein PM10SUCC1_29200 [Propionigenium maris DSM 9537]|uniref:Lipoprotein n=1 Tax=Propionigenium maris DSM 9537 TaxID=1123000 RepID=A0A9W6LNI8_9FUSO|nr:hypothetical protein [Propionigenium maris]GLI57406.1 hypothetical protein PM10SUCC1_29200 [Propionigenium maris DSM 9537]
MKKTMLALSLVGLLMACGENGADKTKGADKMVTLTKAERENKTEEELLGVLLSKAVYKEATQNLKGTEDKQKLEFLKRRAVNDYYILSVANKNTDVSDEEILTIYNKNKGDLQGKALEDVEGAIKSLIYEAKLKQEIGVVVGEIRDKYALDEQLKKYLEDK